MDILTHIASGLAAGTVVAGCSKRNLAGCVAIVAAAGLGGALPDLDAVSLWSKFDATIGRFLHLEHPGAVIYSDKFWYSHHGFLHSLAAAILLAAVIATVGYLFRSRSRRIGFGNYFRRRMPVPIGFVSGFVIHLLEDMPTPASTWGGVRLFWPLENYVGGTGNIWWWNNYDLFLIAAGAFWVGAIVLVLSRSLRFNPRYAVIAVFALGCVLSLVQIHSRDYDYAYTGHTERYLQFEAESKKQQQEILGEPLYRAMEWFDRKLPVHF